MTPAPPRARLAVTLGPFELAHPLINASGTMELFELAETFGERVLRRPPVSCYVPKTVTIEPRPGNPPPRILETEGGMLNSIGLPNEGIDVFVATWLPRLVELPVPVIVSLGGFSLEDYVVGARSLRQGLERLMPSASSGSPSAGVMGTVRGSGGPAGAGDPRGWTPKVGLELNISCPNVRTACISIGADDKETAAVVAEVRAEWPGLLVAKLTPNVTDIVRVAQAAEAAGATALAVANTYKGMAIDRVTLRPYLGGITGGVSGPAIKPLALRAVYDIFAQVEIPLIGMGGVASLQDVLDFLACGARLVAVGSAGLRDPWLAEQLAEELSVELASRGSSLEEVVGAAHGK